MSSAGTIVGHRECTPASVAAAAQLACLLEVSAPKPGNVHPGAHFHDTRYEDFLASAVAIAPAIAAAGAMPLGATIRAAVQATLAWTRANTNLGIVLLLAPVARAVLTTPPSAPLRTAVRRVLAETTLADAVQVYAAIRLAHPGGLGAVPEQDVSTVPSISLLEAMALAAERDAIAREYGTGFALTFDLGVPAVWRARNDGLPWNDVVAETYLTLLAATPDTLIERKLGPTVAAAVSRRAGDAAAAGGVRTAQGRAAMEALDAELRDARNAGNPGTTADLTAVSLFVALLQGAWHGAAQ